mmetsp:Transcript_3865/g.6778  ORF Transcript_3865/g.6778 Transcript_3865/m.6778 type:complete len:129 (-) Transcript_3865:769-1155(-)|eukprot:CAMPEP_0196656166 /NCGR_PEP_ID=MMETSP1086-20130531/13629_1 /TAXON_ID=77921 /ORGANISM="Cyanoptyche  gloeocystis , Strain SAG4.97" /LENGTH=128 /DNA_ID=CAMNT_0041988795 /DNA_START=62 /DNA_END=448 /DNA_ORIENTATION=+
MSWDSYVQTYLVDTKCVTQGAIIGMDGNRWAGFGISPAEGKSLVAAFSNPSQLQSSGIVVKALGDKKFIFQQVMDTPPTLYLKRGNEGLCVAKTTQCLVIGYYDSKIQPPQASTAVGKLGDYFREIGY